MYRLLKASSRKVNGVNLNKIQLNQSISLPCSLCNRNYVLTPGLYYFPNISISRTLTTQEVAALKAGILSLRKSRKSKKKYVELLEVNEGSSNMRKAIVKNLTSKQISKLAEQPDTTLECLHNVTRKNLVIVASDDKANNLSTVKCDAPKHHVSNYKSLAPLQHSWVSSFDNYALEMEIEKELESELIQRSKEEVSIISQTDVDRQMIKSVETKPINYVKNTARKTVEEKVSCKPKRKQNDSENQKNKILLEKERQYINEKFNSSLSSFIELCVHCDYLNIAFGTLNRYVCKSSTTSKVFSLRSANPFNTLMHGYAKKENFDKINEILRMMKSCGIRPNPQSYAAAFETLGRLSSDPTTMTKLNSLYKDMKAKHYKFQDLFDHCSYYSDQREFVLKAIHSLDPNFQPKYHPPVLYYNCTLVNELNKQSKKPFRSPCEGLISEKEMDNFIQEQLKTELSSPVKIKSVVDPPKLTEEIIHCRNKWNELQDQWRMSIREALNRDLHMMKMKQNSTKLCYSINIYPYLKALTAEQYVDIILEEIRILVQGSETFSPNLKLLRRNLGQRVRLKYIIKQKQQHVVLNKMEKLYKDYCKWYLNPEINPRSMNTRHQWQNLIYENASKGASLDEKEESWPHNIVHEIGRFLYNIIIKDIKTDVNCFRPNSTPEYLPAFYSLFRYQGQLLFEELKPHPSLVRLHKESMSSDLYFNVNLLPMVSPPIPWTSPKSGGYIVSKADFVRFHYGACSKVLDETAPQRLYPVFDSLNQLGSIPWRINEPVLDVVLEVFRKGGSSKLDIPQHSSTFVPTDLPFDCAQKALNYQQRALYMRKKAEMYGLWCEALYRLSLANHFRKRIFWLPHNLDFRGRVYPVPPHLTHLGNDMARSLLRFAKGEKLGPKGLDWLKIHCINLTGLKKRESTDERLKYANEMLPEMLDSAENPLTGRMWWAESEDRWQTLACCMAIKEAIDSGDPENHVSHFPVHQDGSCNGLQHYAALGRDRAGAESVNLVPNEKPQDVYSCVVAMVEAERVKDAHSGSEVAMALEGFIKRKVIKQTIMTTVYGVTRYGARLQIAKQLKDIDDFPKNLVFPAAGYLTTKTFHCLQEMFTSSREIQNWFADCAKFVANECGSFVEWQTPLGLPVVQPYAKTKISTLLNDKNGQLNRLDLNIFSKPNPTKQKNAFPPNFVHSLDSSHMMLTSLFCEREGITFISVHDCYWTHPCSVEAMNKICRKQFVALHSEPILENLSSFLMKKFSTAYNRVPKHLVSNLPHEILTKVPRKGDFNLQEVLQSTYFFS